MKFNVFGLLSFVALISVSPNETSAALPDLGFRSMWFFEHRNIATCPAGGTKVMEGLTEIWLTPYGVCVFDGESTSVTFDATYSDGANAGQTTNIDVDSLLHTIKYRTGFVHPNECLNLGRISGMKENRVQYGPMEVYIFSPNALLNVRSEFFICMTIVNTFTAYLGYSPVI